VRGQLRGAEQHRNPFLQRYDQRHLMRDVVRVEPVEVMQGT